MESTEKIIHLLNAAARQKSGPLNLPKEKAAFFPDKRAITEAFKIIKSLVFIYGAKNQKTLLNKAQKILIKEVKNTFCMFCQNPKNCMECRAKAKEIVQGFIAYLPVVQEYVLTDITAAYNGDPAAKDNYEILLCYPGLKAAVYQRMAHYFYNQKVKLIPRILTEYAHAKTGIDIHPGARLGKYFFIDHGSGVVIGETAAIGDNVKIYQGVTLGARSFPKDSAGNAVKSLKRHPDVEDNVTIYSGAAILGPVRIGKNSTIAANAWITQDVEPNSFCGQPAQTAGGKTCKIKKLL
jgi:serine O-acetyltransferase